MNAHYFWEGAWHVMRLLPGFPVNMPLRIPKCRVLDWRTVPDNAPVSYDIIEFERVIPQPPCLRGQLFLPRA